MGLRWHITYTCTSTYMVCVGSFDDLTQRVRSGTDECGVEEDEMKFECDSEKQKGCGVFGHPTVYVYSEMGS